MKNDYGQTILRTNFVSDSLWVWTFFEARARVPESRRRPVVLLEEVIEDV